MSEQGNFKHFQVQLDGDNVAWLDFDKQDSSTNTLDASVLLEFEEIIDGIASDRDCRGLVISSAKPSGFIAGADINSFTGFDSTEEAFTLIRRGQLVLDKLDHLNVPTVALINGFCLGGGFELALACDYRIAIDEKKTRIGLPEVMLGIHPGWGGMVRLPRLIGAPALSLILTGRTLSASAAKKFGLVDFSLPLRHGKVAARDIISKKVSVKRRKLAPLLTNLPGVRFIIAAVARRQLNKKVSKEHYPAPYEALRCWQQNGVSDKAFVAEASSVARLFMTDTAQQLVRDYFLKERLKSLAKTVDFKPVHVHVVGAGAMGGDIAAWCAYKGFTVTLQDCSPKFIAKAVSRANKFATKKLRKPRLVQEMMDRLTPDEDGRGVGKADVIIEAIFEDLNAKRTLFKTLEETAKPEAILASNTSSIPLDKIAVVLKQPERLVGIHFFNPVAKMLLVEVVRAEQTLEEVVVNATAFVGQLDRLPLPVKSHPGFLINRILMPYLIESVFLLEDGVPASVIDAAARNFGMPLGPVELADTVGLDICYSVAGILSEQFGSAVPKSLEKMIESGFLGRKSGRGFYKYTQQGKLISDGARKDPARYREITDRLILALLNEAVACLSEGIVEDDDLLDAGMIFGTGFAPFRGGPIQYAYDRGISDITGTLMQLQNQFGNRFEPHAGWTQLQADQPEDQVFVEERLPEEPEDQAI